MACTTCGTEQPDGAKFCIECGASVVSACASCGAVVPPAAKFCPECGSRTDSAPAATRERTAGVASRRVTSVLFGDLVGFTSLSESRDQEDVRELLSRYFEESSRIVSRYGGTVEKFIGDAVMAVWGVPVAHEDDAERSVRAGLELVSAVAGMGAELGVPDLAMRVGIVTGEVAVTVGATQQGMVAGDAVNTAARVQAAASPGQVWVDETTKLLTSAAVSYVDVGSHRMKGKADPVPLWSARAVVAQVGGLARADGLEAPLIGRDRELRVVKEVYHRVEETGRPALLVVAGDAGVGKSRLGWEFSKYTDGLSGQCRWHSGKCVSYGEGVAYYALAEAVRSRLETALGSAAESDETEVDTASLIERGLAAYVSDEDERAWLAPRLGALLGVGAAGESREDLFAAWTTFFERVSGGSEPVVMLVDDAQYADDGLVRFLEHVLAVASFPFLVVLLGRPELISRHPGLATNRRATVLNLEPLTATDMAGLVDGLVEGLPSQVRDELVARAEGIPTYAVETVRALIDRDLIVPRGGAYVLSDPESLDLTAIGAPASLQALIAARLDTLTPEERRVVDRASVAGDSLEPGLLVELCGDMPDLESVLAGLVRSQILRVESGRRSSEQGRYQFVQSAVRQVAYGTLARRDRKQTHLEVLESFTREGSVEVSAVAAQHCISAIEAVPDAPDVPELTARAVRLLRQAADRARSLGSPSEAAGHLGRALDLVTDPDLASELRLEKAEACVSSDRYDEAIVLGRDVQQAAVESGDRDRQAIATAVLVEALTRGPEDLDAALHEIQPWYDQLKDDPETTATFLRVLNAYVLVLTRRGETDLDVSMRFLSASEWLGDRATMARALNGLAIVLSRQSSSITVSTMLFEKAVEVAHDAHDPIGEGIALCNLASGTCGRDVARAITLGDRAREVTLRAGSPGWTSFAISNLARAHWLAGLWDDVEAAWGSELIEADDEQYVAFHVGRILVARQQDPEPLLSATAERQLSAAYRTLGLAVTAMYHEDRAAAGLARAGLDLVLAENGVHDEYTEVHGFVLEVALRLGDRELLDHLRQVVLEAGALLPTGLRGHDACLRAIDADPATLPEEVERLFTTAVREYEVWGSTVYVARARAAYGVWLTHQGRAEDAIAQLTAARHTYEGLGAVGWLRELEEQLAGSRVAGSPAPR